MQQDHLDMLLVVEEEQEDIEVLRQLKDVIETENGRRPRWYAIMVDEATDMVSRAEPLRTAVKVGRNDPCPCGSGKKHKKCCG